MACSHYAQPIGDEREVDEGHEHDIEFLESRKDAAKPFESTEQAFDLVAFVPEDHPLREVRRLVNTALSEMSTRFNEIYARSGRDSIAPEKLIRALLLQSFYSIRSERQLCEQLRYNLLFRWFVGLAIDDPVWDHSTFSKNRDRLLAHQVVEDFFAEVLRLADRQGLLSKEHFCRRDADPGVAAEELRTQGPD